MRPISLVHCEGDNGAWASASVNLNAFAGQSVQIVVKR